MADWVSVREVARRRGCTHGAVQKAISTGRIPESAVKRDAAGHIEGVDYEAASKAWAENTDVDQAARTAGGAATVVGAEASRAGELPLEPKGGAAAAPAAAPAAVGTAVGTGAPASPGAKGAHELRVASAEGKQLQNRLLELELLKEIGTLVSREEMKEIAARRYRAMREQLKSLPDRMADILAAESDAARVHAALNNEIDRVLNELADDAAAESSALAQGETAERVAA